MDSGHSHIPKTTLWAILTAAALFFFLSVLLLPYPGLHNDECLFTQPFFGPTADADKITVLNRDVPLMLMSYLGTSKTLLYKLVFKLWRPSVWSIRLPGLVTGAATIWIFGLLLYRLGGSFTAVAGSFLLGIDPSNILTTVFDWGPVAIQHFALVAGIYALYNFERSGSKPMLAGGFFAFGFGMWDKALFSWMLLGLVMASLIFLVPVIRRRLTVSNVTLAIVTFLTGAAPLLIYNVRNNFETLRGNAKMSTAEIWPKTRSMPHTLDGSGLFGYLIREETDPSPRMPGNAVERASAAIRGIAGETRQGWLPEALILVLVLLPWWRSRWRVMAFAFVTALVAWLLMSATVGAGGSVHHVVLMWPVPQFLMAFGLAVAIRNREPWLRRAAIGLVVLVCAKNALVVNQYLYNAQRVGPGSSWTDAIYPLKDKLVEMKPAHVNIMDWGYEFNLLAMTRGKMEIHWGAEAGERAVPNESDERLLTTYMSWAPESVWIKRVEPIEVTPGSERRFAERALARGYSKQFLDFVEDRNGRRVFELYRFVKVSP